MGTVIEYRTRFEQLVMMLRMMSIEWLIGAFLAGLNDRIQTKIRLLALLNLRMLLQMIVNIKQRDWVICRSGFAPNPIEST